jgi:hypothetical protein
MYSPETIVTLNNSALIKALKKKPLVTLNSAEDAQCSPDYSNADIDAIERVTGLTEVQTFFVDSSGFGSPSEAALTVDSFKREVKKLLDNHGKGKLFSCLTGVGQFQVYVTIFWNDLEE